MNSRNQKRVSLTVFSVIMLSYTAIAQQRNVIKLNIGDCINCVSALDRILEQDTLVTFIVKSDFAPDSTDVLEKFNLTSYRQHFIWNSQIYDSLSKEPESELIQFCGNTEVNRSGLRNLKFMSLGNCEK